MQDRRYLLSIEELLEDNISGELREKCLRFLDENRLQRALSSKGKRKLAENIGAGLLLQLAVREMLAQAVTESGEVQKTVTESGDARKAVTECLSNVREGWLFFKFSLSELLYTLEKYDNLPLPLEYTYSEKGKPFLKNYPYYFNLSHSGNYVFCVISEQEVGADIQWEKPGTEERIVRRFFTEEEKKTWEKCVSQEEKLHWFYMMWARKEAYGKLTGDGISAVIGRPVNSGGTKAAEKKQVCFEDYELEDYRIAVCKWK